MKPSGKSAPYGPKHGRRVTTPMDMAAHGTPAGAAQHRRRWERPCLACLLAENRDASDRRRKREASR